MNAKTMSAILEHMDAKSVRICMLDEKLRKADEMFRTWKTLLGLDAKLTGPEVEEAIKRMNFDRTTLQMNYQQHVELNRALDAIGDLPRLSGESYAAYTQRLAKVFAERSGAAAEYKALADKRLSELAALHIKCAKLETRESELNDLHDAIESLPGFPMEPQESYAAYLQRLAAERAELKSYNERGRMELADAEEKNQRLRDVLDKSNQDESESRATIANLEAHLAEASKERDNFRARWEESLAASDRATSEARSMHEANQVLQVQLASNEKRHIAESAEVETNLRVALLIIKCLHSCEGLGVIIDATDWKDECRRIIDMATSAEDNDDLILEVDFADQWGSRVSDPLKRAARMATEHNDLTNRISSVSRLEGELSLHLQVIVRMMMQPTIAQTVNALQWNGSAQQVLKAARGMFGDVQDVISAPKEPSA